MRALTVELTYRCNRRCGYCYARSNERLGAELDTGALRRLLTSFHEAGGEFVAFTGGEVFVRRDFSELLDTASKLGMRVTLSTNGTHWRAFEETSWKTKSVNLVRVSLDGPADMHDRHRGRGTHERVLRFIERLESADVPFELQCTVSKDNLAGVPWLWDFGSRLRSLRMLKFTPMLALGRGESTVGHLDLLEEEALYSMLERSSSKYGGAIRWHTELCTKASLNQQRSRFRLEPLSFLMFVVRPDGCVFPWFSLDDVWCLGTAAEPLGELGVRPAVADALAVIEAAFRAGEMLLEHRRLVDISRLIMIGFMKARTGALL